MIHSTKGHSYYAISYYSIFQHTEGKLARVLLGGISVSIAKAAMSVEGVRDAIVKQLLGSRLWAYYYNSTAPCATGHVNGGFLLHLTPFRTSYPVAVNQLG